MSEFYVHNPATDVVEAVVPAATATEVAAAVERAHAGYQTWRSLPLADRVAAMRRVAELHLERRETLAEIIVRETGKTLAAALGEVDFSADIYAYYADIAAEALADEPIELRGGTGSAVLRREPLGVLLGIMPWNYPYYQVARFAAPNLTAGNAVVIKHAPQCPESAAALEQLFAEALPASAYVNLYAGIDQIESVIADDRVRGVSLTGSERAGAAVAEIAGRHLKKVVLELGGSDPFILLSTDDMAASVTAATAARLENTGQACNAAKRFIVADGLYEEFLDAFTAAITSAPVGNPSDPATVLGPLSSQTAASRLGDQVASAVAGGAAVSQPFAPHGAYFPGTVLTDVTPSNLAYGDEFFGPVAMVFRADSEDEAIRVANDTAYGLGSYVFSTDEAQAMRVAEQLDAGMVFINVVGAESAELPFGGIKRSGFGRELGKYGFEEFINKKLYRIG